MTRTDIEVAKGAGSYLALIVKQFLVVAFFVWPGGLVHGWAARILVIAAWWAVIIPLLALGRRRALRSREGSS